MPNFSSSSPSDFEDRSDLEEEPIDILFLTVPLTEPIFLRKLILFGA